METPQFNTYLSQYRETKDKLEAKIDRVEDWFLKKEATMKKQFKRAVSALREKHEDALGILNNKRKRRLASVNAELKNLKAEFNSGQREFWKQQREKLTPEQKIAPTEALKRARLTVKMKHVLESKYHLKATSLRTLPEVIREFLFYEVPERYKIRDYGQKYINSRKFIYARDAYVFLTGRPLPEQTDKQGWLDFVAEIRRPKPWLKTSAPDGWDSDVEEWWEDRERRKEQERLDAAARREAAERRLRGEEEDYDQPPAPAPALLLDQSPAEAPTSTLPSAAAPDAGVSPTDHSASADALSPAPNGPSVRKVDDYSVVWDNKPTKPKFVGDLTNANPLGNVEPYEKAPGQHN